MSDQKLSSSMLNHADWLIKPNSWVEVKSRGEEWVLFDVRTKMEHHLTASAAMIWQLCSDGYQLDDMIDTIQQRFPDAENLYKDVTTTISDFASKELLMFASPDLATEYTGRVIRKLDVPIGLQWELEKLRQFMLGAISASARDPIEADLDQLLGLEALNNAKSNDVDAANSINDSTSFGYRVIEGYPPIKAVVDEVIAAIAALVPEIDSPISVSGGAVYFPGAHMGWHSNHSRSDGRIYCIWSERENSNFFRYEHPRTGEIISDYEAAGWNINYFTIPPSDQRFWHCIGAESLRFSLGFRFNA